MSNLKTMQIVLTFFLMLTILWQGESCRKTSADNVSGKKTQSVPTGMWGGDHAHLNVAKGGAKIEFDCAHGSIDGPLVMSSDGRFDLKGIFVRERGGPVRQGQEAESLPARYAGSINRKTMTLSITLTDTGQDAGTYTLTHGTAGHLTKCL